MQVQAIAGAIAVRAARIEQIDVRAAELGAANSVLQAEATALADERTVLVGEWSALRIELFDAFAAAMVAAGGTATTFEAIGRIMDQQQGG